MEGGRTGGFAPIHGGGGFHRPIGGGFVPEGAIGGG